MNSDAQREAVYGAPPEMLEVRDDLTPMLSQYADLCETHDDAVVLFQVGDFYEAFCGAAKAVARTCEVTLTKREDSTGTWPMAGIPIDNAAGYLERLLDAGYRVALAEQVEDASEASGLVDRAVTQLITPGTVVDEELLEAGRATYLGAVAKSSKNRSDDEYGIAVVDVSTGECLVTGADRALALEELERLAPAELVVGPNCDLPSLSFDPMQTPFEPEAFEPGAARETLSQYAPRPEAVVDSDAELRAVGALLAYAEYAQGDSKLEYVTRVTRFDPREFLQLDATAIQSLELFDSRSTRAGSTLFSVLDETACALGRRRLEAWLRRPLVDREAIEARLDAVDALCDDALSRADLRDHLSSVYDLERLVARVSRERANARDLRSLKTTLDRVPEIRESLAETDSALLSKLRDSLDELECVRDLVGRAIVTDPPQEITEGGVIADGFNAELDDLRGTAEDGREWVSNLEVQERERTGIDSLEVGYNQVHGYYIEVTNPNLDRVPDDYVRRQTLKNSERFYTPELKEREDEILRAADRADALEYDLFCEVRADVATESERIQAVADVLADLDVLRTLADVAVANDYARPEFHGGSAGGGENTSNAKFDGEGIEIDAGRHPVVERAQGEFVPNPASIPQGGVALITGPNMSGKSTYMRQVALVCILAQMGSFVPADAARLPVVDRVFTRIGASDDIAGGQSTFMREMSELTEILHNATDDSLVLLDEVGRGTSTADGLAIARAATEFVHDEVGAMTLFATHYHDLTDAAADRDGVFNLHFTATQRDGEVTFLHSVADGPSSSSYGVEVAHLAGVPSTVVDRARNLVEEDVSNEAEMNTVGAAANGKAGATDHTETAGDGTLAAYVDGLENGHSEGETRDVAKSNAEPAPELEVVADRLREADLVDTTPLEALNLLSELKGHLE
ncbi:DNA mismatch repair protein MutS [Haloferax mediterranei ATCC 33500]|uniref:DNA mismatch repair protein MutS n=1 Tax=Haloferax mediterranei (strain ATCC 33500 / DSM 1411 / JCM 8866 / NBRC 14739 / NCIMB 2177 / R-4) TaxID=523841 RepID=I3R666_HALMT|nr:DNA mismatch repair protein MutS [Haloferax mediterranei]AFK19726.2 DNA mismatch repair protein MutS [Haloferax mediterranei ATCC 33500]AHZ23114.1 DNA mismatch repair protein MutS [Haloferax mediterranei ATCC 33500]EMA00048.1 DNA mismatch repair protein MutS [Haloferax mediterranei ATCC 33500]MDX5987529.1 DNA mismatch repair protein MutS [Haloferax mediterranei ATCC 33500]QCQ74027.1 DNA mismatch repair protein MutS [Haloferax mediterranei ATCC 33500]